MKNKHFNSENSRQGVEVRRSRKNVNDAKKKESNKQADLLKLCPESVIDRLSNIQNVLGPGRLVN